MKLCFVIMGYGKKTDPTLGKTYDLDKTYHSIIKPAVENVGFTCVRSDEILESGMIDKNMYALLIHADLCIADITTFNPNAIYELGIRHAARPFSTIIMKEKDGNIPFDLNHNKIFTYSHMGEDIGYTETLRCVNQLTKLIKEVDRTRETDSPLFHHIKGVQPYTLPKEEYTQIIEDLAKKENAIFATVEAAKNKMAKSNFSEAKKLWKIASERVGNDAYYIQQWALSTYKDKSVNPTSALLDALSIINKLEPDNRNTNDPETLGITGAIYKGLWLENKENIEFLDRAIDYYKRGFTINQDYYTGENYTLCLDLKSEITKDEEEKIYLKFAAKKNRKEIIKIIENLKEDEDFESRSDLKWLYATLANCYFSLDDHGNFELYNDKFLSSTTVDWEIETYNKGLEHLKRLKN
ncbi:TRAFs-binding domain-containing protein [Chryseobacterium sp. PBS4-4]|uniref:TRAFs-binding domain-containing protein n=1 Tax=Chryseobacterium edaphi TaxID=2976532 RepID=A0ABT2W8M3_9FLAO|nr:TRAFs-binding domain-containing protein [Chryseobacterium edaphi]MCU7618561.1 TRAFs-binding domain-containing protein [Chryseobacterium edaphi]